MDLETSAPSHNYERRLGKCEVCNNNLAKYTCPKCEVKTCCLPCLQIHKKELDCNGVRDKTKYIPIKQITESDLMNDYVFLESCTNYTAARRHDKIKRFTAHNKSLPNHLSKLKAAAAERRITLQFLLQNFDKHNENTTFYDWRSKVIYWRVEWRFINANCKKIITERCNEHDTIATLIERFFDADQSGDKSLEYYRSKGLARVRLLLKAEGIRNCRNRFYLIDLAKSINENLQRRTIVEFPVIYVAYDTDVENFDVIDSDEEDVEEETRKHKNIYLANSDQRHNRRKPVNDMDRVNQNEDVDMTEKIGDTKPTNFLFTDENDLNDYISDDSDP